MQKSLAVAFLVLAAAFASPRDAHAAIVIDYTAAGAVLPGADCPPPPALPNDCTLTALATYTDASGAFGPWASTSTFTVFTADPIGPNVLRNAGTWYLDDTSPGNNDLFGTFTGFVDQVTFMATLNYVVNGGTGVFAGMPGVGLGNVQVALGPQGFTFTETGRFVIPSPGTLALLGIAAAAAFVRSRRPR